MLELHCHTTFSDGTLTPRQLVERAVTKGVKALAITDHDTIFGWNEARAAAQPYGLEIVPGIELSTVYNERSMHILGFYPDPKKLEMPLNERIQGRHRRAKKMVDKLAELGFPIELPPMPGNMAPGRPHVAKALLAAGHVTSQQEAFQRFIGDHGPAYVPYEKFTAQEGIALLRQCGAVPIWAHPYLFRGGVVEEVLPELVKAGLMGVEVYHPQHSISEERVLEELCEQYGLLMTGGSDYHGPQPKPKAGDIDLNGLKLSLELLDDVKQAAANLSR
ncbi:metal-dependent php family [Leptolyngbya sp. Heron Island J]|uniref:PHP domain-containing protein n=1 Tax=Leptolyngbya sp. Heron Island J TaxID=1385935 RepID=UPI0003B95F7C|nr:PHP domain-containing protein [Leptolyngbya sp. Heron Island J]ESA37175.1 metal-dependent php family [Leptolyngbya sp. Heron Island J]